MKIHSLTVTNFRCFKNEFIHFAPYTAILGPNNSGKSTLFKAIDLFFQTTQKSSPLALSDFNDTLKEMRITLTFSNLPNVALEDFKHYHRHGRLEFFIRATINAGTVNASIHGQRAGIKAFSGFYAATNANEKKENYQALRGDFPGLPELPARSSVEVFASALREFEAQNPDHHEMIESEDLAFGAAGVTSRLRKYIDWLYIPAVKDAGEEDEEARNTAFGVLINRIISVCPGTF